MSTLLKEAQNYEEEKYYRFCKDNINQIYEKAARDVRLAQSSLDGYVDTLNKIKDIISEAEDPTEVYKKLNGFDDFGRRR